MIDPSELESHADIVSDLSIERTMDTVDRVFSQLLSNESKARIIKGMRSDGYSSVQADLLLDIAMTRKKASGKFDEPERLFFTSKGLRWATPEIAAKHCASRLGGHPVADITCGQGGQLKAFSEYAPSLMAIDIDPLNCFICSMNVRSLGLDNVRVINSDCLSDTALDLITNDYNIFSDPARPPGSPERRMDEILPDPREVIRSYGERCRGICFEIPPYMSLERIDFKAEVEYISIDGRINRLNLYLGDLMECSRSAVILPGKHTIKGEPDKDLLETGEDPGSGSFINEVDPSVVRSGLLGSLIREEGWNVKVFRLDARRTMLVSDSPLGSGFIKDTYEVLGTCSTVGDLKRFLKDSGAGSVTIRYQVDPKKYWMIRNDLEGDLEGSRKMQVFKGRDFIVACKLLGSSGRM